MMTLVDFGDIVGVLAIGGGLALGTFTGLLGRDVPQSVALVRAARVGVAALAGGLAAKAFLPDPNVLLGEWAVPAAYLVYGSLGVFLAVVLVVRLRRLPKRDPTAGPETSVISSLK